MPKFRRMCVVLSAILLGLSATLVVNSSAAAYTIASCDQVPVIAHRGANSTAYTENTPAAYLRAIELGADVIEGDLQLSADGHWIPMHDATVDRTTDGTGRVSSLTLAQLQALRTNDGRHGVDAIENILPALRVSPTVRLELEVKSTAFTDDQLRELFDIIDRNGFTDRVLFTGKDSLDNVPRMRAIDPSRRTAYVTLYGITPTKAKSGGDVVVAERTIATSSFIAGMHAAGVAVEVYLLNSESVWRTAVQNGADGVLTNYVTKLLSYCTPDTTAPSTPTAVHATEIGADRVTLEWAPATDNVGVLRYDIVRDGVRVGWSLGTSFTDAGLRPETAYTYRVAAVDAAGLVSGLSAPLVVPTAAAADLLAPSAPTGLAAVSVGDTSVTLGWIAALDDRGVIAAYEIWRDGQLLGTVGEPGYLDATTAPQTTYQYAVLAVDPAGNRSPASDSLTVTTAAPPDTTAPSAPTDLTAQADFDRVSLTWAAASDDRGVAAYEVSRDGVVLATAAEPGFVDRTVAPLTSYRYAVTALDAAGNRSATSDPVEVSTPAAPPDITPPGAPIALRAEAAYNAVTLSWEPAVDDRGIGGYRVLRDGELVATVATPSAVDSTVAPQSTYSYTVLAVDTAGNESSPSEPITVSTPMVPDLTAPSVPTDLAVTEVTPSAVSLTWTAATDDRGVADYLVSRDGVPLATVTGTSYTDPSVTEGQTYGYQVQARDEAGNASAASDPVMVSTPIAPDLTPPTAPAALVASTTQTSVTLSWTPSTDERGVAAYEVIRDGLAVGSGLTPSPTPSFTDTGLTPTTTYHYTVVALDAAGNRSAPSAPVTATTLSAFLLSESFSAPDGSRWSSARWTITSASTTNTALHSGGVGVISLPAGTTGWVRARATGMAATADTTTTLSYTFPDVSAKVILNVYTRASGSWGSGHRPADGYGIELANNSAYVSMYKRVGAVGTTLVSVNNANVVSTAKHWLKIRVAGSTFQFKTWLDGQPEPTGWTRTVTDVSVTGAGQLYLAAYESSSNVGAKSVILDDITVAAG